MPIRGLIPYLSMSSRRCLPTPCYYLFASSGPDRDLTVGEEIGQKALPMLFIITIVVMPTLTLISLALLWVLPLRKVRWRWQLWWAALLFQVPNCLAIIRCTHTALWTRLRGEPTKAETQCVWMLMLDAVLEHARGAGGRLRGQPLRPQAVHG
jgi:hypothetical protein